MKRITLLIVCALTLSILHSQSGHTSSMTYAEGEYQTDALTFSASYRVVTNQRRAPMITLAFQVTANPAYIIRSGAFVVLENTTYRFQAKEELPSGFFQQSQELEIRLDHRPNPFHLNLVYVACTAQNFQDCTQQKTLQFHAESAFEEFQQPGELVLTVLSEEESPISTHDDQVTNLENSGRDMIQQLIYILANLKKMQQEGRNTTQENHSEREVTKPTLSENQFQKQTLRGTLINSVLEGAPYIDLGEIALETPNVLIFEIRDVSLADASSILMKSFRFTNITRLPYEYQVNISDIIFTRNMTYSIRIHLDANNNGQLDKGDFYNSVRHTLPFRETPDSLQDITMDVYIGRLER